MSAAKMENIKSSFALLKEGGLPNKTQYYSKELYCGRKDHSQSA